MPYKKKIGIIGGMGSRAGALFLKKVIDYSPAEKDQDFPEIIYHNNSNTPDRTRAIVYHEPSPLEDLLKSIRLFNQNEVELVALACITSYYYYDQLCAWTDAEVINPLKLVAECISREFPGVRRVGLLATTGTVNTGLFHQSLAQCSVEIITLQPDDQEQLFMNAVYMKNGFKSGNILPKAGTLLRQSVQKLVEQDAELIIGGCTEVSVGWEPGNTAVPFIDVLDLLAKKMVERCYSPLIKKSESLSNG